MALSPEAKRDIAQFLRDALVPGELRRVVLFTVGDVGVQQLPGEVTSIEELSWAVTETLVRHGGFTNEFFELLIALRPRRSEEITKLRDCVLAAATIRSPASTILAKSVMISTRLEPGPFLIQIRLRSKFTRTAEGLAAELALTFPSSTTVEVIVEDAEVLVQEYRGDSKSLRKAMVTFTAAGETAWRSALREAASVGPVALAALLLAAQKSTDNYLEATRITLARLMEAE